MPNFNNCTELTDVCTYQVSTYGYEPSLGANVFFVAFFGLCLVASFLLGVWYKTWSYMVAVCLGCLAEVIGYVGRLIMRGNPFADTGFITQICCLIIAPAFLSAAVYLTLKHITLCFGPEWSYIKPRFYTYTFISFDLISLVLQAVGGALASTANDQDQLDLGDDLMMAGISWQVVALLLFAIAAIVYVWRRYKALALYPLSEEASATINDTKFRLFVFGVVTTWATIFVRCVYRIVEMAGGWGNSIMQDEPSFIVLEGVMIVIAAGCQTALHPGFCFPRLSGRHVPSVQPPLGKSSRDVSMEDLTLRDVSLDGATARQEA